ncbi:MAG: CPBP family intramembrane glutamic endopeptidase [Terracidiphilus sp.]
MDPENQPTPPEQPPAEPGPEPGFAPLLSPEPALSPATQNPHRLTRIFIGPQGLRSGWSVLLFLLFTAIFFAAIAVVAGIVTGHKHRGPMTTLTPYIALLGETLQVLAILGAGALVALIERRRILDYNLRGPHRFTNFLGGLATGFVALSALVGALAWGKWLHFGAVAISGPQILGFGAVWALAFLLTGFFEEGSFRCFFLYTLTRGLNFWWALALVAAACLDLVLRAKGNGVWGVYVIALLLLVPCLILHLKRAPSASFWEAAWVTSTYFGFLHTSNNGENWIGIFSAAAIGFVFCVSVWVTGSAWWAIGCHAAWDWAETYFYGTADSGMIAKGHFLTTHPAGNVFWSGGTDGPEGSVLVLGAIALILLILLVFYRRKKAPAMPTEAAIQSVS